MPSVRLIRCYAVWDVHFLGVRLTEDGYARLQARMEEIAVNTTPYARDLGRVIGWRYDPNEITTEQLQASTRQILAQLGLSNVRSGLQQRWIADFELTFASDADLNKKVEVLWQTAGVLRATYQVASSHTSHRYIEIEMYPEPDRALLEGIVRLLAL